MSVSVEASTGCLEEHPCPFHPELPKASLISGESEREKSRQTKNCSSPFAFTVLLNAGDFGVDDNNPVRLNLYSADTDL